MNRTTTIAAIALMATITSTQAQLDSGDVETFLVPFADLDTTYFLGNSIIPGSNDFDGGIVIDARIELSLTVIPTGPTDSRVSDAAFFQAEAIVPVDINLTNSTNDFLNVIITGENEGWSGSGNFTVSRQLDDLIGGQWVSPVFYSSSTYAGISQDEIVLGSLDLLNSYISVTVQQVPAPGMMSTLAIGGLIATRRRRR
jgi:hypothetical protein